MNWLNIDNPEIDAGKLQREIDAEVERIQSTPEFLAIEDEIKRAPSLQTPEEAPALIEIAEAYDAGWDGATLAQRRPILKPLLPIVEKILKKILKPQYIFNSLALEIIRKQEERIQALEKKISG